MTIGKLENSIGVEVLIATIMISSDSTILNVNMMSSMNAGIGKIRRVRISRTTAGVAIAPQMMLADNCRKFDIRVLNASILNSEYQYLSINRRFLLATSCAGSQCRIRAGIKEFGYLVDQTCSEGAEGKARHEKEKFDQFGNTRGRRLYLQRRSNAFSEFSANLRYWICSYF